MLALVVIAVPLYQLARGTAYFEPLDYIDGTTLVMIGILLLRCVIAFHTDKDLQAVSIALIAGLSFVYTFEALYKWSFYISPWLMPPSEFRELVIQIGIALTGLVGFAFGKFKWSTLSKIFTAIFVISWVFWLSIGFPQIFSDKLFLPALLPVHLSQNMVYLLNRVIKFVLFLVFFFSVHPTGAPKAVVTQPAQQ